MTQQQTFDIPRWGDIDQILISLLRLQWIDTHGPIPPQGTDEHEKWLEAFTAWADRWCAEFNRHYNGDADSDCDQLEIPGLV